MSDTGNTIPELFAVSQETQVRSNEKAAGAGQRSLIQKIILWQNKCTVARMRNKGKD